MALFYMVSIQQDTSKPDDLFGFASVLVSHNQATLTGKYKPFVDKPGPADNVITDETVGRTELYSISRYKKFIALADDDIDVHSLHQLFWLEQQRLPFYGVIELRRYPKDDGRAAGVTLKRLNFKGTITGHVTAQDFIGFNFSIMDTPELEEGPVAMREPVRRSLSRGGNSAIG